MTPRELSPRQREILALVAAGRTSKEIAGTLGISESTVNWHIANVFERLGASSRAEAVAMAMREDAQLTDDPTTSPKRPARPPLPTSSVAIAVALTLILGLLGGALMAGWNVTAPIRPSSSVAPSVAPSSGAPQKSEPTVRPSGAGAPTQEGGAAAPERPTGVPALPIATSVPATPVPLLLGAPSIPALVPALPTPIPTLQTIAPTSLPVVGPLPTAPPPVAPLPTLPPAPSVPLGLP